MERSEKLLSTRRRHDGDHAAAEAIQSLYSNLFRLNAKSFNEGSACKGGAQHRSPDPIPSTKLIRSPLAVELKAFKMLKTCCHVNI